MADLARAIVAVNTVGEDRVHSKANVAVGAFHEREIVSGACEIVVLAVAEFEESLRGPLAAGAPFSVTGKAHADALVRSRDSLGLVLSDSDGLAHLVHLEAARDLVDAKVLGGWAVVANLDVEGIRTA